MLLRLFGIPFLFFSLASAFANEVVFDGYYRVELEHKPIGYVIIRNTFDPATKTFESNSFLRLKLADKITTETTRAKADDKFHPISFAYTGQLEGGEMKMIDGTFKGETMTVKISDGKKVRTETSKIPKGTFLSSFLTYLLMQQKLELNQAFKYSAVAEEDGGSYWGKAWLVAKETKPGLEMFTVMNKFKNDEFLSKLALVKDPKNAGKYIKAEVLSTNAPAKNFSSQLMPSAQQATEGMLLPNKLLLKVFGNIPTGKVNLVANPPQVEVGSGPKNVIPSPVPAGEPVMLDKKPGK